MRDLVTVLCVLGGMAMASAPLAAELPEEKQLTFSVKNHCLDNNDNFSPDGRFLCYDTREGIGPGIDNCQSVEKVDIATGEETLLYAPPDSITGEKAAPGVGAASFHPLENKLVFIHGPLLEEVAERGYYGKPNRQGMEVAGDGSGQFVWLDKRDTVTSRDTLPGAHRGGTHRHEYSRNGKRVGFTYDDVLLPAYGRTIGYMEAHPDAPEGATHYCALLVPVVPAGTSKSGEIEYAAGDSWVDAAGAMRAFIGKVRAANGIDYEESLFVIDMPPDIDITTADSGSATRYPAAPKGVGIRRLTHGFAAGIVRGSPEGGRIAYYAKAPDGTQQVFVIPADGSDRAADAAKRPVQVTHLPEGTESGLRWHPSGKTVFCLSNNAVVATCVEPGPRFGKSVFLTAQGGEGVRNDLVVSPDGKTLAFDRPVPTLDKDGHRMRTYAGADYAQIFLIAFPDGDGDGVAD